MFHYRLIAPQVIDGATVINFKNFTFAYNRNMRNKTLIVFSVICFFCVVMFVVFNFVIFPTKYKNYVVAYAKKYNLNKSLVYAVIKAESNFDEKAVSKTGARGLMQLIQPTAEWIAEELELKDFSYDDMFNPEINVWFGCFYLNYLSTKFKDEKAVICAYNAGEGVVRNWLDGNDMLDDNKISYAETKKYLSRVTGFIKVYQIHEICL